MFGFNNNKKANSQNIHNSFFSKKSKSFGNNIRNITMIEDISLKMIVAYENRIKSMIAKADVNSIMISLSFSLSRMGVIFIREGDTQGIDVSYNSYGYAAVEELEKRNGIAWVLQDIICSYLLNSIKEIKNISIKAHEEYGWTRVTLVISIETNKYKEL